MPSKVHVSAHTGHFPGSAPSQIHISPQVGKRVSFSQVLAVTAATAECWAAAQATGPESADQPSAATTASRQRAPFDARRGQRCRRIGLPVTTRPDTLSAAPLARRRRPVVTRFDLDTADASEPAACRCDRARAQCEPTGYGAQSKAQRSTTSATNIINPSTGLLLGSRFALAARIPAAAQYPGLHFRAAGVADAAGPSHSQFIGQWRDRVELGESIEGVVNAL